MDVELRECKDEYRTIPIPNEKAAYFFNCADEIVFGDELFYIKSKIWDYDKDILAVIVESKTKLLLDWIKKYIKEGEIISAIQVYQETMHSSVQDAREYVYKLKDKMIALGEL